MFTTFIALIMALMSGLMPNTHEGVAPASQVQEISWEDGVLKDAGVTLAETTTITFTEVDNCGSAISPTGTGGGCTRTAKGGAKHIIVSPQVYGTEEGQHILLHEAAHSLGITDECQAEYFAHDHGSRWDMWSYMECRTEDD